MLTTKHVSFDFKAKPPSDEGVFEGLLSRYGGPPDEGGDIVDFGAYDKNLKEKGTTRPLLWQHQQDQPLGTITLKSRQDGLYCTGKLVMSVPQAKAAFDLIKAGAVSGLSIGYKTIRQDFQDGVRHLKELALYEGSVVTMPMAPAAQISSIKSLDHSHIETALLEFKRDILAALERKSL